MTEDRVPTTYKGNGSEPCENCGRNRDDHLIREGVLWCEQPAPPLGMHGGDHECRHCGLSFPLERPAMTEDRVPTLSDVVFRRVRERLDHAVGVGSVTEDERGRFLDILYDDTEMQIQSAWASEIAAEALRRDDDD